MERPSGLRTCLYAAIQLDAVMENMARQAAGLLAGKGLIVVVGILRRGAPLADRLAELLVKRFGLPAPLRPGARQDSCHLSHAAIGCLFVLPIAMATTDSRSGLSVTGPAGDQLRV